MLLFSLGRNIQFILDLSKVAQFKPISLALTNRYHWHNLIRYIQGVLFGLHKAKEANKDKQEYHKYDILIFKEELKIAELTGDLSPDLLLKEMAQFSD